MTHPILTYLLLLGTCICFSQANSEVYLLDFSMKDSTMTVSNFRNISNNDGYDSQPSFIDNNRLLYAGGYVEQSDIMMYTIDNSTRQRVNRSTVGGEYSPQLFPDKTGIAAVRLDPDGKQRIYKYEHENLDSGAWKEILPEIEVAYYAFHDSNRMIASVLAGDQLDLKIIDLTSKKVFQYIENVGRSIHKIPNSNSVSYTLVNEDKNMDVYMLDIDEDGESFFVCQLPVGVKDHCWISTSALLLGSGSKLYVCDLFTGTDWKEVTDLASFNISEITRVTVSPDGKKLAITAVPN